MSKDQRPPRPAANDEQTDLAALKALLLGEEQSSIRELQDEAHSTELQTQRVADSLPDSLHKAYAAAPQELARALETPVSECIEDSVQRNPDFFADVLYPVMGPAIRRSISQALKGLVQQINETLEHSLTIKGLRWRIESLRTGLPFAEIVLRHTLRYRIEEVFLIQSGSGLLIQHVSQGASPKKDADAVSAMLTAIRDFTHDTLDREDPDSRLETIDVGDHTLWLIHGPKAYLACAIRGIPPIGLRDELADILEDIHQRRGRLLEAFDGDPASTAPLVPMMEPCLHSATAERAGRRFPWAFLLVALLVGGLLVWGGSRQWQAKTRAGEHEARLHAAVAELAAAPGIVLTDWRIADGRLRVQGLHDPLTPPPAQVLAAAGLAESDYALAFRAHQSSDPKAALARARQRLAPPASVGLSLDPSRTLIATGFAPQQWNARAALLATTVPGVEHYDDSGVLDADRRLERRLRAQLQPPDSVRMSVEHGIAEVSGEAPLAWIRSLPHTVPELPALIELRGERLRPVEWRRMHELVVQIESATVDFVSGVELDEAQSARVEALAGAIGEAFVLAKALQQPMRLELVGRTDGTGTPAQNHFVSRQRAQRVADALLAAGPEMPEIQLRSVTLPPGRFEFDYALRRVEFRVLGLRHPPAPPPKAR